MVKQPKQDQPLLKHFPSWTPRFALQCGICNHKCISIFVLNEARWLPSWRHLVILIHWNWHVLSAVIYLGTCYCRVSIKLTPFCNHDTPDAWWNFDFITLPGGPWQAQNFIRCGSVLSHSINIHSKVSGSSKPPRRKLNIIEYKSRKIPHMVKCHIQTLGPLCDLWQEPNFGMSSTLHDPWPMNWLKPYSICHCIALSSSLCSFLSCVLITTDNTLNYFYPNFYLWPLFI